MFYRLEEKAKSLGLDKYCYRMLCVMLVNMIYDYKPTRFNELFRLVARYEAGGTKMSKPTFNKHLQHLIKKGYVTRKKIGKQNVECFLNRKNMQIAVAKLAVDDLRSVHKYVIEKISKLPLVEVVHLLADYKTIMDLSQLYISVKHAKAIWRERDQKEPVLPEERFRYAIAISLFDLYFQRMCATFFLRCTKNREDCEVLLKTLDDLIETKSRQFKERLGNKETKKSERKG